MQSLVRWRFFGKRALPAVFFLCVVFGFTFFLCCFWFYSFFLMGFIGDSKFKGTSIAYFAKGSGDFWLLFGPTKRLFFFFGGGEGGYLPSVVPAFELRGWCFTFIFVYNFHPFFNFWK